MLPLRNSRSVKELEEEIEILKEENEDLKVLTGLQRERKYYNKFVKEVFQKEKGSDLIYPDFDEIYKRYFELLHQREKIVEQLEEYKNLECDDPNEDIDEEVEDAEELYDIGRSQGKLEAYLNAIEIVKSGGK